jgi:hypothetical protein
MSRDRVQDVPGDYQEGGENDPQDDDIEAHTSRHTTTAEATRHYNFAVG